MLLVMHVASYCIWLSCVVCIAVVIHIIIIVSI